MTEAKKAISVLLLSRYPRNGSSSRLRFLQFIPALEADGIEVTIKPFFPEDYLTGRYAGRTLSFRKVLTLYMRRLGHVLSARRYDVVWLEGEVFPFLPAWAERLLSLFGARIVVDYDDALFHRYDLSPNPVVKLLLGGKIAVVMRHASVVTVGNEYLGDYARRSGAQRVEFVPTVVDAARYNLTDSREESLTIGWIGTPITMCYLEAIARPLEEACTKYGARLRLVGADESIVRAFNADIVDVIKWSEDTESENMLRIDVGVMPLRDSPWEEGKCGYKLIQYMASGAPVIATHTEANAAIVLRGECGFVIKPGPDCDKGWSEALHALLESPELRFKFGRSGRLAVEEFYSVRAQSPRISAIFQSLVLT